MMIQNLPTADQISLAIMTLAETGSFSRNYGKVTFAPDDPGGLSVGWGQAAYQTREATLKRFFEQYASDPYSQYGTMLAPWLPKLAGFWGSPTEKLISRAAQSDPQLHSLLKAMASDPVWRGIQDQGFLEYHKRAMARADKHGYSSDLLRCLFLDMEIQHGGDWLLERAVKAIRGEGHTAYQDLLKQGVGDAYGCFWPGQEEWDESNELDVVKATLIARIDFLMTEGQTPEARSIWPKTTYRCNHLMWLAEKEVLGFDWGMSFRTIHPAWMKNRVWSITPDLLE
jgi:hypothetical protein